MSVLNAVLFTAAATGGWCWRAAWLMLACAAFWGARGEQ